MKLTTIISIVMKIITIKIAIIVVQIAIILFIIISTTKIRQIIMKKWMLMTVIQIALIIIIIIRCQILPENQKNIIIRDSMLIIDYNGKLLARNNKYTYDQWYLSYLELRPKFLAAEGKFFWPPPPPAPQFGCEKFNKQRFLNIFASFYPILTLIPYFFRIFSNFFFL